MRIYKNKEMTEQVIEELFPYPVSNIIYDYYIEASIPVWKVEHKKKIFMSLILIKRSGIAKFLDETMPIRYEQTKSTCAAFNLVTDLNRYQKHLDDAVSDSYLGLTSIYKNSYIKKYKMQSDVEKKIYGTLKPNTRKRCQY
jgi:hypothetical protein